MEDTCLKTIKHKFLWWKWEETYYEHSWIYYTEKLKRCEKCNEWGRYFGTRMTVSGNIIEDWRKTKLTREERNEII